MLDKLLDELPRKKVGEPLGTALLMGTELKTRSTKTTVSVLGSLLGAKFGTRIRGQRLSQRPVSLLGVELSRFLFRGELSCEAIDWCVSWGPSRLRVRRRIGR